MHLEYREKVWNLWTQKIAKIFRKFQTQKAPKTRMRLYKKQV